MPFFSLIIPVYNMEKYIRECVESIVNQTFTDFEAIFVDDCGSDNSMKIVEEYADKDKRIKIIRNGVNKGVSASRNAALNFASGNYVLCIDSDDWIELNALEIFNNQLKKDSTIDSIWFDVYKYYDNTHSVDKDKINGCSDGYMYIIPEMITKVPGFSWGKLYRTSILKDAGIYWPEEVRMGEDGEFSCKFFAIAPFNSKVMEDCLYYYRINDISACSNLPKGKFNQSDYFNITTNVKNFYSEKNIYSKYKTTLLQLMRKNISNCRFWSNNMYDNFLKLTGENIKNMDFPNEFKEFDYPVNPKISLIFPIRDNSLDIEKIIKNIQHQKYKNFELICLHNNDENIRNILSNYSKKDRRIISVDYNSLTEENIEIKNAKGFYVMFINEHTILQYNSLDNVIKKFIEINVPSCLLKSQIYNNCDYIGAGYISLNEKIKSAIETGKVLPVFRKKYLEECGYNILNLVEKYKDMFLF